MTTRFKNVPVRLVDSRALASPVVELERDMQRMLRLQFKEFIHLLEEVPGKSPGTTYVNFVEVPAWNRWA